MKQDIKLLFRLMKDRRSPEFKTAPLWLVVKINSEISDIKRRLNPLNWRVKLIR